MDYNLDERGMTGHGIPESDSNEGNFSSGEYVMASEFDTEVEDLLNEFEYQVSEDV